MENAAPTERSRKARRSIPVPAGSGCPGSIAGSPRPAAATPRRSRWARLKSLQEQPSGMSAHLGFVGWVVAGTSAHLQVWGGGDQHAQRVLTQRAVGAVLPFGGHPTVEARFGEGGDALPRFGRERGFG